MKDVDLNEGGITIILRKADNKNKNEEVKCL